MKKVIKLTENDLTRLVNKVIKESKNKINEDVSDVLVVLTGAGLYYLGRKIKKFLDRAGGGIQTIALKLFLSEINAIEEGKKDGEVLVKENEPYKVIAVVRNGKVFDSITVDMENDEIYTGTGGMNSSGPKRTDKIIPSFEPKGLSDKEIEELRMMEDALVNGVLDVILKYGEPKE